MVISYPARIPDRSTFKLREGNTVRRVDPDGSLGQQCAPGQEGLFLMGRFSAKSHDVCEVYYRTRGKSPPYLALAECSEESDAILEFTSSWGLLVTPSPIPIGWKDAIGKAWCPWRGDADDFLMDITGWIHLKRRFDLWLSAAMEKGQKARTDVLELMAGEAWHAFDAGNIELGLAWRSRSSPNGRPLGPGWVPEIKTKSLYSSFVAMLWLDVSTRDRMLLRCENPACGRFFSTDRTNKIYCDNNCAIAVAKQRYRRRHQQPKRRRPSGRAKVT